MPPFDASKGVSPHESGYANQLSDGLRRSKYMYFERLSTHPVILQNGTQAAPVSVPTLPTAVQDNLDTMTVNGAFGQRSIEFSQTTAQTLMPLRHATKGIEIALDQVDNECVEYVPGGNHAANPLGYLAGTDPGVFIRAQIEVTANNGSDQLMIGFRKQQNYLVPAATWNYNGQVPGYTDFAAVGFAGAVASPNAVRLATSVGNAACVTSALNFTVASAVVHQLEIRIKGRAVSVLINGKRMGERISFDALGNAITAQNTVGHPSYTFTSGLFLIPFIFVRQDTVTTTVFLRKLEIGQLLEVGLDPSGRGPSAL